MTQKELDALRDFVASLPESGLRSHHQLAREHLALRDAAEKARIQLRRLGEFGYSRFTSVIKDLDKALEVTE